jgi:hypothetical protein
MNPKFDIFRVSEGSHPLKMESAWSLDEARTLVQALGASHPGKYVIFSNQTGNIVSMTISHLAEGCGLTSALGPFAPNLNADESTGEA